MEKSENLFDLLGFACFFGFCFLLSTDSFAADRLANVLTGDVGDTFKSNSNFWNIFILVDIILATAAAVKTKNPMVFAGVAGVAFVPAFLLKAFVF